MSRIFHPEPLAENQEINLSPENSHHLVTVLRLPPQSALSLFCGDGYDYEAILIEAHKKHARVKLGKRKSGIPESPLHIHLAQSICRGEKMDFILQKAVELGVTEITPIIAERTQGARSAEILNRKHHHYEKIIISAAEQSERSFLPKLHPAQTLEAFLKETFEGTKILLCPLSDSKLPLQISTPLRCLIGPEGGFSEAEIELAQAKAYQPILLGPRILRTETAALAFIASVQAKWGDFFNF